MLINHEYDVSSYMAKILSPGLAKELVTRVIAITAIYSVISYFIVPNIMAHNKQPGMAISLLFVIFGVVILISVLYCLRKYNVMNLK